MSSPITSAIKVHQKYGRLGVIRSKSTPKKAKTSHAITTSQPLIGPLQNPNGSVAQVNFSSSNSQSQGSGSGSSPPGSPSTLGQVPQPMSRTLFPQSPVAAASPISSGSFPNSPQGSPSPDSAFILRMMKQVQKNTEAVVNNPVTLQLWYLDGKNRMSHLEFKDMLTRWAANGNTDISKVKRNSLIPEATRAVIHMHMKARLRNVDKESWMTLDNTEFHKLMAFLFKKGRKDECLAEQIRKLTFCFDLDVGYESLTSFFRDLAKLKQQYEPTSTEFSAKSQKTQVDAIFKFFPRDKLHKRLEERICKQGKPASLDEFETKAITAATDMYDEKLEMEYCDRYVSSKSNEPKSPSKPHSNPKFSPSVQGKKRTYKDFTSDQDVDTRVHNGYGHFTSANHVLC